MRRDCLHLFPLISILLLFPVFSYGQAWSGMLTSSRAIDWGNAGLPATFPDGETTPNPWTPPTRTQCTTSQCNTVSGGTVTLSSINAAIASAPSGTYVLIPAGTYSVAGTIAITSNNVTLRGSGANSTKLTGGTNIQLGIGVSWGGSTLLTANPSKGATSVTVTSAPSAGRIAALEQCDDGLSATSSLFTQYGSGTNCTGTFSDPLGPWICGLNPACDRNGGSNSNPHDQGQVIWIRSGGVSGNTVNFTSPVYMPNWSTARTASLIWLDNTGVVGAGVEDLSVENGGTIRFQGTYACWAKGVRIVTTATNSPQILSFSFDANSLVANSYIAGTVGGPDTQLITWGSNSGEQCQSNHLFINNIGEGGWGEGGGCTVGNVFAYNYWYRSGSAWVENGEFQHSAGTSFLLREGNQVGLAGDDDTWGTHNFNTFFRNWISDNDPPSQCANGPGIDMGGWARFENVVGNVLGNKQCSNTYGNALRINGPSGFPVDNTGLTQASTMVWGNYAVCIGDTDPHCGVVTFNNSEVPTNLSSFGANSTPYQSSLPSSHNLPASFFINNMTAHPSGGTGLSWWKTCTSWTSFPTTCASYSTPPMPPFGPDVTGGQNMNGYAWNVPAALARFNLPTDPTYGNAIVQFDERVYQNDSGGSASAPSAPTGLTAAVQ